MTRFAHRLIGFGLWLAQRRRGPFPTDCLALGRWAVATLNAEQERVEIAKRHAKPSTRRVVTL
jgi:hypothetical protein